MGHRVGEVEEKRPRVVAFDKRDSVFGILRRELRILSGVISGSMILPFL
jgi:hypothetical protein